MASEPDAEALEPVAGRAGVLDGEVFDVAEVGPGARPGFEDDARAGERGRAPVAVRLGVHDAALMHAAHDDVAVGVGRRHDHGLGADARDVAAARHRETCDHGRRFGKARDGVAARAPGLGFADMQRIFSNGPLKDYVVNPFNRLVRASSQLCLAAPYFTFPEPVVDAARSGKKVRLLIGLNSATDPKAVAAVLDAPAIAVRYFTRRFHSKIYVFDEAALIGSANLTDGGLMANREAVMCLDQADDLDAIEEMRSLFLEMWDSAPVLTPPVMKTFASAWRTSRPVGPSPDDIIEKAVGRAEPANIHVASRKRSRERLFQDELQRQIYEQYLPAFDEISRLIDENGFRRPELSEIGLANETNRFLNWVRLSYVHGDDAWRFASVRPVGVRRAELLTLGAEWATAADSKVPSDYIVWLKTVRELFGSREALSRASKADLTAGLMSLHAFTEQLRFVKGGLANLPAMFWGANRQDVEKVRATLVYFIHGQGDVVPRLHDVLYDPAYKINYFGRFCALELYGSVKPRECPPVNGRMAKALRYLGFDVRAS